MPSYEYGVAYEFDENGAPLQQFVEMSDDEQDARAWAGDDPSVKIVRRQINRDSWEVA